MSFRRRKNSHDAWIRHREESAAPLVEIGLPIAIFESEQSLVDFLTSGRRDDLEIALDAMTEPQFWKLFHCASSWFDLDAAGFKALERRRLRGQSKSSTRVRAAQPEITAEG